MDINVFLLGAQGPIVGPEGPTVAAVETVGWQLFQFPLNLLSIHLSISFSSVGLAKSPLFTLLLQPKAPALHTSQKEVLPRGASFLVSNNWLMAIFKKRKQQSSTTFYDYFNNFVLTIIVNDPSFRSILVSKLFHLVLVLWFLALLSHE